MESERAKKSRSVGSELKSSRPSKSSQRPELGERVKSAPSLDRGRDSQAPQTHRSSRTSATSDSQTKHSQRSSRTSTTSASTRSSKQLSRNGVSSRSYDALSTLRDSTQPPSKDVRATEAQIVS
jgi:hypothetical protein